MESNMDNESEQGSEQTATTDSAPDTNSEAYLIAMGGAAGTPEEAPNAGSTDSPTEAKPAEQQAAEEGQQADDTEKVEEKAEEAKPEDADTKAESEKAEAKPEDETKVLETEARKRLNLLPQEPETVETLQEKYKNASREAHRLVELAKAKEKYLADVGVQLIQKDDGSLGLIATDKYTEQIDTTDVVKSTIAAMTEDQKLIFDSDESAKQTLETLAKEVTNKVLSKRPPVNATADDVRLPNGEVDAMYNAMAQAKIGEEPVYPDIADEVMGKIMFDLYSDPTAKPFYVAAHKSKENMQWFLDALHGRAFRAIAPLKAKQADALRQKEIQKQKKMKEASVRSDGSAGSGMVTATKSGPEAEAERIARAGGSNPW